MPVQRSHDDAGQLPHFAVSACTTYHSTFAEDLANYQALDIDGIGLWEYKLPPGRDDESVAMFQESGLTATFCFPNVPGVIYGDVLFSEPKDPRERLTRLKAGIRRLARFRPLAVACLAGPPRDVGVRLALEVIRPGPSGSLASTIPEACALIADIGVPNIDVLIDTWHFWDSPQALADIRAHGERIVGVQVNDRSSAARGWGDRALPGRGDMDLTEILKVVRTSGFSGWYELEIFSDDGTLGT